MRRDCKVGRRGRGALEGRGDREDEEAKSEAFKRSSTIFHHKHLFF
jgi:hypothetical protein